jgi:hypothetical protein
MDELMMGASIMMMLMSWPSCPQVDEDPMKAKVKRNFRVPPT